MHATKRIENRTWGTSYRGWLAIDAPARWDNRYTTEDLARLGIPTDLPLSAIVGAVYLHGGHRCPPGRTCDPGPSPGRSTGNSPTIPAHVDRALRDLLPRSTTPGGERERVRHYGNAVTPVDVGISRRTRLYSRATTE